MELPIFNTYINFSRHHSCCFTVAPLFVLGKSTVWNRCLQHPCFKNLCKIAQASKNSYSNAQHFLSDLLTHSWFHSVLFALPGYQFPRCFHLTQTVRGKMRCNRHAAGSSCPSPQKLRLVNNTFPRLFEGTILCCSIYLYILYSTSFSFTHHSELWLYSQVFLFSVFSSRTPAKMAMVSSKLGQSSNMSPHHQMHKQ
jgi:hypothetical protein